MTFGTLQLRVFADELIFGVPLVIKSDILFPRFQRVTVVAIFLGPGAFIEVHIIFFMATHAARLISKITSHALTYRFFFVDAFVALRAFDLRMLSLEFISGEFVMVEVLFINGQGVILSPFMFGMTLATGLGVKTVKTFLVFDKGFEFLMAVQALAIRNPFSRIMTF